MLSLILLVLVALGFGYFATQNTQLITLTIASYSIPGLSLYVVLGITLLVGFAICWLISLSGTLSKTFKLRGKDNAIKDAKKTIHTLSKNINDLELENAKLKGELKKELKDDSSL